MHPSNQKSLLLLLLTLLLSTCTHHPQTTPPPAQTHHSILGLCWVGSDSIDFSCLDSAAHLGANYLSITPFAYQPEHNTPELRVSHVEHHAWGESQRGILHTSQLAESRGMHVIIKPHIWMPTGSDKWRQDIAMHTEADWQAWFEHYKAFILPYAHMAELGDVEALCIGTELHQTVLQRPDDWRALIADIRTVYSGKLTYAANFYQEYEDITFWDALDFIGVQGYFPLSEKECPTVAEVEAGWAPHIASLKAVSERFDKPVVFTEIGYRSDRQAAIRPWEWPDGREATYADTSYVTQARCYEAFFRAFDEEPWMQGLFVWKWFPRHYAMPEEYERARLARVAEWKSKRPRVDFTPQDKPAEAVIRAWFWTWRGEEAAMP